MKKVLVAMLALVALLLSAAPASADEAAEIAGLSIRDPLNRNENPLSNGGRWTKLNWAAESGQDTTSGWTPATAHPTVAGVYFNPATFTDSGAGNAAEITLQTSPSGSSHYVALWLNMPKPGSEKSGYQLIAERNPSLTSYTVKLVKWVASGSNVLASNTEVAIPAGTTLAISDTGGTVKAWKGSGGSLTSLLSASDSTYSSGYVGIEAAGTVSRSNNFQAGPLLGSSIAGVPVLDSLLRDENPLGTTNWTKPSWASEIGGAWNSGGYLGYGSNSSGDAAAYWNNSTFSHTPNGVVVASTIGTGARWPGEYLALLLNLPQPSANKQAHTGYEARFAGVDGSNNYTVEIAEWASGARTVLASKASVAAPPGTTIALTEIGGGLTLWAGTTSLSPVLVTYDSTYTSGYAGLEVKGAAGTQNNFKAGGLALSAPAAPTVISTSPAGPANNNSPKVIGSAAAGSTVKLYTNSTCTSSVAATGTATAFASPGLTVSVADNSSTPFYATATDAQGFSSPCSGTSVTYVEDSIAPAAPTVSSTSPASPANNNAPKVIGSAAAGSTVKLYTNSTCTSSVAATGTAAAFASPGLTVNVANNTTTTYFAAATDAAGNVSPCSTTSVTYIEDSIAPAAPTLTSTSPASGADDNSPEIKGSAEAGSTVKLYTHPACTTGLVASGSAATFASPGITVNVADNTTTSFRATATDAAGNTSGCLTSIAYKEITPTMYWGAWLHLDGEESPWDLPLQDEFEKEHVGKSASLIHWSSPWYSSVHCGGFCNFQKKQFEDIRARGSIPFFSWSPEGQEMSVDELLGSLEHRKYVKDWAEAAKAWGHPFFLRFAWEMNGNWFDWGVGANGNTAADVKELWIEVHKIFDQVGGVPATWVWCPNINDKNANGTNTAAYSTIYPGDQWVDWTCLDGYNKNTPWRSFDTTFKSSYEDLTAVAPGKPVVIGEVASVEGGEPSAKASWITAMFNSLAAGSYPKVHGLLWFNKDNEGHPYEIESSAAAQAAFASGIQNGPFAPARYSNLNASPIPPTP